MLRRWLYPYLPERRVWILHVVALGTAAFVTLAAFIAVGKELADTILSILRLGAYACTDCRSSHIDRQELLRGKIDISDFILQD